MDCSTADFSDMCMELLLAYRCLSSISLSSSHIMAYDAHISGCHRHSSSNSVNALRSLSGAIMTAWCYDMWLITGTVTVIVGRKLQGKNKGALLSYWPTYVPESSSSSLWPSAWLRHTSTCFYTGHGPWKLEHGLQCCMSCPATSMLSQIPSFLRLPLSPSGSDPVMETDLVSKTLVFDSTLRPLNARDNLIRFMCCESFKSYSECWIKVSESYNFYSKCMSLLSIKNDWECFHKLS
jgi:hypothetical protein